MSYEVELMRLSAHQLHDRLFWRNAFSAGKLVEALFPGRSREIEISEVIDQMAGSGEGALILKLTFEDEYDAMLFKLAWDGEA